ncbi:MAG: hypothetical protein ABWX70_13500 [Hyphomicrobium sp.]
MLFITTSIGQDEAINDAGIGADRAGVASLPILDSEEIAAATVAADSACIGDD